MAYDYQIYNAGTLSYNSRSVEGILTTDAVAHPSMTVTPGAGAYANITCSDNTGFKQTDVIQIDGGGTAGANMMVYLRVIGRSDTTVDTTKICIRQYRPVITAVGPVTVSPYYKVWTRFRPAKVELFNRTTLIKYEWYSGMNENTVIITDAAGAVSETVDTGIVTAGIGFAFHPSLLGTNSTMMFKAIFSERQDA